VAQRVGRGIALLFHESGTRRGVSGQQQAPAVLYPRERPVTHFAGGWVGPRAGQDGRKNLVPTGIRTRAVHHYSGIYTKPHSEWPNGIWHRAKFKVCIDVSKKNICFQFSGKVTVCIPSNGCTDLQIYSVKKSNFDVKLLWFFQYAYVAADLYFATNCFNWTCHKSHLSNY